jgi:acetyl esterase/lipase
MLWLAALVAFAASTGAAEAAVSVSYGPDPDETATVYPSAVPNSPVWVYDHGGWWNHHQNPVENGPQMEQLQAQGFTVVNVNYPQLAHPFPGEDEAIETAVRWTHLHAIEYNGDPLKVFLLGSSAGGQLALMAALHLAGSVDAVSGVAELSAPGTNFVTFVPALLKGEAAVSGKVPVAKAMECPNLKNCSEAKEREWSPVYNLPTPILCPPMLLAYGKESDLQGIPLQTKEMLTAAQTAGCQAELVVAPKGHAIAYFGKVKTAIVAFARAH